MKLKGWLILFCLCAMSAYADYTNLDFHEYVLRHYDFHPHQLSSAERTVKSAEMDEFWHRVQSSTNQYLPLLRKELSATNTPAFFLYDGSELLLSVSRSKDDQQIAARAVTHCDLVDVQNDSYFYTVYKLALGGQDVVDAAFHILSEDQFSVSVPQHALVLGQDYCFLYLLSQADDTNYFNHVVARLKTEKSPVVQKTLLRCLWYTVTKEGLTQIEAFAADKSKDASSVKFAKDLLKQARKLQKSSHTVKTSYDSLKAKRKEAMRRVSDEALIEYDEITFRMFAKMK